MLGTDPSVQHPPTRRGGHPCSFSKDLSISCHSRKKSTAWDSNRIQVQLSAQEDGWVPCINIAAGNLTVKAECELSWTWFKQDIEVNSMEMLASCKSLVENGIMVRQPTLHNRADWNTEYAFDDIETWEEISTLIAMYLEVKKIKLITKNPRLQASKHQNHILSDLLPLPSELLLAWVKNSM